MSGKFCALNFSEHPWQASDHLQGCSIILVPDAQNASLGPAEWFWGRLPGENTPFPGPNAVINLNTEDVDRIDQPHVQTVFRGCGWKCPKLPSGFRDFDVSVIPPSEIAPEALSCARHIANAMLRREIILMIGQVQILPLHIHSIECLSGGFFLSSSLISCLL